MWDSLLAAQQRWAGSKFPDLGRRRAYFIVEGTKIHINAAYRDPDEEKVYVHGLIECIWYSVDFGKVVEVPTFQATRQEHRETILSDHPAVDRVILDANEQAWMPQVMAMLPNPIVESNVTTDWIELHRAYG